jgi:Polysaccharide lyase
MKSSIVTAVIMIAPLASAPASAQVYRSISGEGAAITAPSFDLAENGRTYRFITKGDHADPWISPTVAFKGTHSIAGEMPPTSGTASDGSTTDKSQHRVIAGNETDALGFMQDRCTGFAVRLETNFQNPDQPVQIFQWWQGTPFSPPLELRVKTQNNALAWELVYRNDQLGRGPTAAAVLTSGGMSVNNWYRFVVCTKMSYSTSDGMGNVKVWLNGASKIDMNGIYGYDPTINYPYAGSSYKANAKFDIFFGLYRPRQAKRHKLFFDQVRYGVSRSDVDPDQ